MKLFNSLGSNYDLAYALRALFAGGNQSAPKLTQLLADRYQGQVLLFYKGRQALETAIKLLKLPENTPVAINGYTCYAVYQSIKQANASVVYLDIDKSTLNFSLATLQGAFDANPQIKVVVIQNTLGYPGPIKEIAQFCRQQGLILIEDLAHSVGASYDQTEAGTCGDFTVLSFSQDKLIDGVSGGALIIRNKKYQPSSLPKLALLPSSLHNRDRFYPILTWLIRATYTLGLGKVLHKLLKGLHWLSAPMADQIAGKIFTLPDWYCTLILQEFKALENNLKHRREIAHTYAKYLPTLLITTEVVQSIDHATNLRFPIFVKENRAALIQELKQQGVYISDIWYDAPIAPKKYLSLTDYQHQCPEAEKTSEQILNLPTHQNITKKQAQALAERIDQWQKSQ